MCVLCVCKLKKTCKLTVCHCVRGVCVCAKKKENVYCVSLCVRGVVCACVRMHVCVTMVSLCVVYVAFFLKCNGYKTNGVGRVCLVIFR